ncbi:hypothetical protein QJS66_12185 [Kocuria rhizophila]|nr:hypothetical protein QJS66_12185 [Kocuria rhizophila]
MDLVREQFRVAEGLPLSTTEDPSPPRMATRSSSGLTRRTPPWASWPPRHR